jgi:endonuclease IV
MGKINVFGSVEEISDLVKETGCSFCIDFAHILARDKKIDYVKIEKKNEDGSYSLIHTSAVIDVSKKGIIKERFKV